MIIDNKLIDELLAAAASSPRMRMNRDLRNSPSDHSQRMLNALHPGTRVAIHRHCDSSETVIVLRGKIKEIMYNDKGERVGEYLLEPSSPIIGMNIPKGQWHTVEVLTPSVIIEMKDGEYKSLTDEDILSITNSKECKTNSCL